MAELSSSIYSNTKRKYVREIEISSTSFEWDMNRLYLRVYETTCVFVFGELGGYVMFSHSSDDNFYLNGCNL